MSAALKRLWMALALATVLTVGTSARAADPVLVWHAYRGEEKQALEQVLSAWQKRTGIPVEALQVPHDAYASKLAAAAPRGHGPHVFIDSHERLGDLVERSAAKELPALSPAEAAQYQPRALEALTDGDHVRGLPIALKCIALYVNPALLAKVPDTLEGIFALKEQLPPGVFPIAYEANNVYFHAFDNARFINKDFHAAILHAFGGAQLLPNGDFGFVGPAAEKSVELVRSAVEMGAVPEEASGALVDELFKSGRAATVMSGPYFASDIGNAVKYRVVPLPKIAAANAPMKPFLTVEAVALTPKGVQRPDAEKLARFIAGPESAAIRARVGRQVVARAELPEVARNDPFLTAFAEQAKVAVVMPSTPRMRATWEPARRALVKSLNGTVAPAAALAEAQTTLAGEETAEQVAAVAAEAEEKAVEGPAFAQTTPPQPETLALQAESGTALAIASSPVPLAAPRPAETAPEPAKIAEAVIEAPAEDVAVLAEAAIVPPPANPATEPAAVAEAVVEAPAEPADQGAVALAAVAPAETMTVIAPKSRPEEIILASAPAAPVAEEPLEVVTRVSTSGGR